MFQHNIIIIPSGRSVCKWNLRTAPGTAGAESRRQNAETGKKPQSGMIPVFCGFFCYGYDAMVIIEIPADERPWIAGVHPVRKN